MPIIPSGGCNEREDPTLIGEAALSAATGVEYRPGLSGIYTARGRSLFSNVAGTTGRGLYWAGYDDGTDYLIYQEGDNYRPVAVSGVPSSVTLSAGSNTDAMVGCHYGNRHYLVNGVTNVVAERNSVTGLTFRTAGMVATDVYVSGSSVTQGSGAMSVTTGLVYWITEYDSVRGIESVYGATSTSTGGFANLDGIVLTISGSANNATTDKLRLYRTTDGGAFPDGGLLATLAVGATTYTDTYTSVSTLGSPSYGTIEISGLNFDRDVAPPALTSITEYEDSLCGFKVNSRSFVFTPAGYPESWPTIYEVPLDSENHDIGTAAMELNGALGLFTRDSVWRLSRLPREVDSAFASGEVRTRVTGERGCISRRGVARYTIPGSGQMLAFVSRDGIYATNLDQVMPVTDGVNWDTRVDPLYLDESELTNDPVNRRLVFLYRKQDDTEKRGVMYLNYEDGGLRITHPDHGALETGTACLKDGVLEFFTADSRSGNGNIWIEGADTDASEVSGANTIPWSITTASFMPAGPHGSEQVEKIAWQHDTTTDRVAYSHTIDGTAQPARNIDFSDYTITDVGVSRECNTVTFSLEGTASAPIGIRWFDPLGIGSTPLGGRDGA